MQSSGHPHRKSYIIFGKFENCGNHHTIDTYLKACDKFNLYYILKYFKTRKYIKSGLIWKTTGLSTILVRDFIANKRP